MNDTTVKKKFLVLFLLDAEPKDHTFYDSSACRRIFLPAAVSRAVSTISYVALRTHHVSPLQNNNIKIRNFNEA
jgi:hypothetical protein